MARAVLGGGVSGLTAAYYLTKSAGKTIKVFEASSRLGGWIKSVRSKNGTLFEVGPRMIRHEGETSPAAVELFKELNLMSAETCQPAPSEVVKKRMIYLNNRLIKVPTSFLSLFVIIPPFIKPFICAIMKDYKTPKRVVEDESMYDFVSRRFGKQYAETLISALVCGIFAGDAKEISVKAIWGKLFEMEQRYGSVIRGVIPYMRTAKAEVKKKKVEVPEFLVWGLRNGMETLPVALKNYLEERDDVELHLGRKCSKMSFYNGKAILTMNGLEETASHVYSTLPSKDLAQILGPELSDLKDKLLSIPFVSVGVVNLEFSGNVLKKEGFGFLVPPNQNLPILGITFDSCIFPQKGITVLTVMMGGKWFEQHFGSDPKEDMLLEIALEYVRKILQIEEKPIDSLVTIARDCLPQYLVGHSKKVGEIREYIAKRKLPLTLIGTSFDGIGILPAINSAKNGVERSFK